MSALGGVAAAMLAVACGEPAGPTAPGPGVVFTYPVPGQHDVPTGARLVIALTDPVDAAALDDGCGAGGEGAVCVVGPDGPVAAAVTVADEAGKVLHVEPALAPGTTYDVRVSPALLGVRLDNVPEDGPLLSFHTRQARIRAGEPAAIATVNGHDPGGYASEAATPALPMPDFGTPRLLMSEPLDPHTAILGQTVRFVRARDGLDVDGELLVQGVYLGFDPAEDLEPGARYRLELLPGLEDLGGEPVPPAVLHFAPRGTRVGGALIENVLNAQPGLGDPDFPGPAPVLGGAVNALAASSPLIGESEMAIRDGSLRSQLGDPENFDGVIPITIRKGELLRSTGLSVAFGGEIPSGLDTGDIEVRFVSDATGYLIRNPYRDPGQTPDDDRAPVWVVLAFDVAVTAADPVGNAVLTQTLPGVQVAGVAVTDGRALAIETTATLELDLMGAARASTHLVLRLITDLTAAVAGDAEPPALSATYPAPGEEAFTADDSLLLVFSEPIELADGASPGAVTLTTVSGPGAGNPVDVALARYGSALIVTPAVPLAYGSTFELAIGDGIRDVAGNPLELSAGDPTGGQGVLSFSTPALSADAPAAPILIALVPGAPCALVGGGDALGRCAGGAGGDPLYAAAELPADRAIVADFSQPMDADTLRLGASCGEGSVRVEVIDGGGACQEAVPGALIVRERGFRFVPTEPWAPGRRYRLALVAGPDAACDPGEICGGRGAPLNTDPLCGTSDAGTDANACANGTGVEAGGPDIEIPFTGAPATADAFVATIAAPHTDENGNGLVDPDEVPRGEARAIATITAVGGFVREAWFSTTGCLGPRDDVEEAIDLTASLPVSMGGLQEGCALGGGPDPVEVDRCIPVALTPQILLGTSIDMCADAEIEGATILASLKTRQLVMRLMEVEAGAVAAAIARLPGRDEAQLFARMTALMDAPDMRIVGMVHDLRSKPVTLEVAGPVEFTPDGRIRIRAANTRDAAFRVEVAESLNPANTGFIEMTIRAGDMTLQLLGLPAKDQHVRRDIQ